MPSTNYDPLARFTRQKDGAIDRLLDCYQACHAVHGLPDRQQISHIRLTFSRARAAGAEAYGLAGIVRDYLSAEAAVMVWPQGYEKSR